MVASILGGIAAAGGAIADIITSQKQRQQAANLRKQTMAMKPLGLQKEQLQKLEATKFAALAGLPTYELYKNALQEQGAQSLRNIRQTAPTGSSALEATSAVNVAQNAALNDLAAKDALAKLELQKEARTAMGEVGALKDAQRLRTDKLQMAGLEQVSKLENAATYNQTLGLKNIAGAFGKTFGALSSMNKPTTTVTEPTTTTPTATTATTETPGLDGRSYTEMQHASTSTVKGTDLSAGEAADINIQLNELLAKESLTESEKFTASELRRLLKEYSSQ